MAKNTPITEFDLITLNPLMQVIKAIIPFLDLQTQKTFSIMIRLQELQQTMQFYNNIRNHNPFAERFGNIRHTTINSINDILSNEEILNEIVKYCPDNYASMINGYLQFSKMSQMFEMFNTDNSGSFGFPETFDPSSLMNLMKNFNMNTSEPTHTTPQPDNHNNVDNSDQPFMQNIMNAKQQSLYEQYMKELDSLDFNNLNLNERN